MRYVVTIIRFWELDIDGYFGSNSSCLSGGIICHVYQA
jgi:hypothetical protein